MTNYISSRDGRRTFAWGLRFEADLGLLPNEAFVHADGRPVEFVEVDEESARGVLGELLDEDEAPAQAVGVG